MAISSYLTKYRSTLPTSQGNQLLQLLVKKKNAGEIRTLDEFKAQLNTLTATLLSQQILPSLKLFQALQGKDISSEQYNEMLDRIQDDLQTAFTEANNVNDLMDIHHNLIDNVALKSLRYAINHLESQVDLYEFLSQDSRGFDDSIYNTFNVSEKFTTSRTDSDAAIVFSDFRQGNIIERDCLVDLVGERLSLGTSQNAYASLQQAQWLQNDNSITGELDVTYQNSNIDNVIDGKNNSYWIVPILLSAIRPTGVPMEVAINTASSSDINFVDIEPASDFPMVLSQVDYIDGNNTRQTISTETITLTGATRVNFRRITTKTIILRVTQNNYTEIQFVPNPGTSNFTRAVLGTDNLSIDIVSASEDIKKALSSDFLMSSIMNLPSNTKKMEKYFQYVLGFDNIRPGFNMYDSRSVFVSNKKTILHPGQFGLKVDERRPVQVAGSGDIVLIPETYLKDSRDQFDHSVVEYYLTIKSFNDEGTLLAVDSVPILPLGAERVYHEQVVLTFKNNDLYYHNNVGTLRFYCDSDLSVSDVRVYRNGTILSYGSAWAFIDPGVNNALTLETPDQGSRMCRSIQILSDTQPLDIYTVSYNPTTSNTRNIPTDTTLFDIVDLSGDYALRMLDDNIVLIESTRYSQTVAKADIYLTIIMRRNSAIETDTPFIEEYMLLTSSRDSSKFEGAV